MSYLFFFFFFQAEDGIRDFHVTGVQTCALPISPASQRSSLAPSGSFPESCTAPPPLRVALRCRESSPTKLALNCSLESDRPNALIASWVRPTSRWALRMTRCARGAQKSPPVKLRRGSAVATLSGRLPAWKTLLSAPE